MWQDMYERFVGQSAARCCELIAAMLGRPVPPGFVAEYRARSDAALASQLQTVPGIEATLDTLDRMGVRYCVASNGTHEKMRTTLGTTGLLTRLEGRLFGITDVAHGKPAPDLFLLAAARYAVAPSNCVVIEDTPTGVSAQYPYTGIPAATPAVTTVDMSSITTQFDGATSYLAAASRNRSGAGLPWATSVIPNNLPSRRASRPVVASVVRIFSCVPLDATQYRTPMRSSVSSVASIPGTVCNCEANAASLRARYSATNPGGTGRPSIAAMSSQQRAVD